MKRFNKENICYIVIGILSIIIYLLKKPSTNSNLFITSYLFLILMIYGVLKKNDILINTMAIVSISQLFVMKDKDIVSIIIVLLIFVVEFIKNSKFEIEK